MLCKTVIGNRACYYFDNRKFTLFGREWEIVASEKTGFGAHEVTHTIKDKEGNYRVIKMVELLKRLLLDKDVKHENRLK